MTRVAGRLPFADPSPRSLDALAATALLVLGLFEAALGPGPPDDASRWLQAGLTVLWCVPLVCRRRWPVPVLIIVVVCGPLYSEVNLQGGVISFVLAAMLAAFTVGRHTDAPTTWWGPVMCVGFNAAASIVWTDDIGSIAAAIFFTSLIYGGMWLVGFTLRGRERRIDALARDAVDAVSRERARIARELHDVITHSISIVTIQTQAVRRRLARHGDVMAAEVADLAAVETTARQAMAELRRLLGVLRADGAPASLHPQPGLDQLPPLVDEFRAAGLSVRLEVRGGAVPIPPGVDLAAYRIVQQALTNVLRHAPGATTEVVLHYEGHRLGVEVTDDGAREHPDTAPEGGHGLVGMRERVHLYGGTLEAGPAPTGFAVRATLPVAEAAVQP